MVLMPRRGHGERPKHQAPQGQMGIHLRWEFGGLQEWYSIFGGENDVHQNKGERLRHIQLHFIYMFFYGLDLAPL